MTDTEAADHSHRNSRRKWRISDAVQSHTVSVMFHAGLLALLLLLTPLAAHKIEDRIEVDIIEEPIHKKIEPPQEQTATKPPPPAPQDPLPPRPRRVPPTVRQIKTAQARAYHPQAKPSVEPSPNNDAPPAHEQSPAPRFEVALEATVEGGEGIEVVSSFGKAHNVRADPGQRGDRNVRGAAPPRTRPLNVEVANTWEITKLPEAINSHAFKPDYPLAAKSQGLEGAVVVALDVSDKGEVLFARVVRATDPQFIPSALSYCKKLLFVPARAKNQAVASHIKWEVHYRYRNQ